jgi:multidrug resistance efflux pump
MKKIILIFIFSVALQANSYMAQILPYEKISVLSETSGLVTKVNKDLEYKYVQNKSIIVDIEKKKEKIELISLKMRLKFAQNSYDLKKENFLRKQKVRQINKYDKNIEKSILYEHQSQIQELKMHIKLLEYTINKKRFGAKNKYVGKIHVHNGDYVDIGSKIMDLYTISKSKIELYIREKEIKDLNSKKIYINDKVSNFKIEKISQIKDEYNLSSFFVRIVKENKNTNKYFGNIVKIEFK